MREHIVTTISKTKESYLSQWIEVEHQNLSQTRLKHTSCIVAYLAKAFARREHRKTCLSRHTHTLHPVPISFSIYINSTAANDMHTTKPRADIEKVSLCPPVLLAS